MSARQQAALEEVEHAALSLRHDLFLAALSVNVILAECREALATEPVPNGTARLIVIERGRGL